MGWSWERGSKRHIVVVNLSPDAAQARVPLPWPDLQGRSWRMTATLDGDVYERDGDEMVTPGLFVSLAPWSWHMLALEEV